MLKISRLDNYKKNNYQIGCGALTIAFPNLYIIFLNFEKSNLNSIWIIIKPKIKFEMSRFYLKYKIVELLSLTISKN